jgi:integrase
MEIGTATTTVTINNHRRHIEALPKVELFLDSKGRGSKQTRNSYLTSLVHFSEFISAKYSKYDLETILKPLLSNEIDLYQFLDAFVSFDSKGVLSVKSRILHLGAAKSYLAYHNIDIIPSKFKNRVTPPRLYREDEEALSHDDIRKIFLACNKRRLKPYLMLLESSGPRAVEGLSIILKDVDFSTSPVKIHIRKQYSKTKVARDSFITDEAAECLNQWIEWKYRDRGKYRPRRVRNGEDLIFAVKSNIRDPHRLYMEVRKDFNNVLEVAGFNERKDGMKRRKLTLHSFRRFTKSIVSDQAGKDYSEWLIGHAKSPYYTKKMPEKMEIYKQLCMPSLTILDYSELKTHSKNIEVDLAKKEAEIRRLTEQVKDLQKSNETEGLKQQLAELSKKLYQAGILKKD